MSDEHLPTGNTPVFQLLAIIATAFASAGATIVLTGDFVIGLTSLAFAIFLFIVGLKWSSVRRHASQNLVAMVDYIARYRKAVFLLLLAGLVIYGVNFVYLVRSDLNKYVMPRSVTAKQSADLREYLSHYEKYPVIVKVNPLDVEAREYAGQILNALRGADWNAAFNTSTVEQPLTMNDGLCFQTTGENSVDPKHNPKALLEVAFRNAEILVNCSGSTGGGDYKLFVLVGHRPLVVGNQEPVLSRVGRWIASLSR